MSNLLIRIALMKDPSYEGFHFSFEILLKWVSFGEEVRVSMENFSVRRNELNFQCESSYQQKRWILLFLCFCSFKDWLFISWWVGWSKLWENSGSYTAFHEKFQEVRQHELIFMLRIDTKSQSKNSNHQSMMKLKEIYHWEEPSASSL